MKQMAGWKAVFVAVVIAWAMTGDVQAQNNFVVNLNVECEDVELRTIARGFFSRELRELGDVGISNSAQDGFRIEAIAIKEKRGWVMSTLITEQVGDGTVVIEHALERAESTEDLGRHIALLVKGLDRDVLKPRRKAMK